MKIEAQRLCRGSLRQAAVDVEKLEGGGTTIITTYGATSDSTTNNHDDLPPRNYPWSSLELDFPSASSCECQRFWKCYGDKSAGHLQAYLDWRTMYDEDLERKPASYMNKSKPSNNWTRDKDRDAWELAWEITWNQVEKCQQKLKLWNDYNIRRDDDEILYLFPPSLTQKNYNRDNKHHKHKKPEDLSAFHRTQIPQYVYAHQGAAPKAETTNQGSAFIMLQVMPAQIDVKLANAEIHSLATGLYLLQIFRHHDQFNNMHDQNSSSTNINDNDDGNYTTADMWLDVRGAPPWANPKPLDLIPLIRTMEQRLLAIHPERLRRLIIFPLPKWAVSIYNIIHGILPKVVQERAVLIAGSDRHDVPPPMERMVACMSGEDQHNDDGEVEAARATLSSMERIRHQAVTGAETRKGQLRKAVKL